MSATVLRNSGSESEPFTVAMGVETGMHHCTHPVPHIHLCHPPPHWLRPATGDPDPVQTDGRLFNLNLFKAKSKISTTIIMELQYTDDNAIACRDELQFLFILLPIHITLPFHPLLIAEQQLSSK
ncbi:hypothetical protein AAFF_G00109510 [Aldrovandia affinis]|uniref:Uncharacterized protein n=1 Tax=Aldrovandia affinis TaxID=143900 RepID=A0AAD7RTS7_9TELE|nr:hypothetical protein AAFF_G00109510 [Aldrovandia affinis]